MGIKLTCITQENKYKQSSYKNDQAHGQSIGINNSFWRKVSFLFTVLHLYIQRSLSITVLLADWGKHKCLSPQTIRTIGSNKQVGSFSFFPLINPQEWRKWKQVYYLEMTHGGLTITLPFQIIRKWKADEIQGTWLSWRIVVKGWMSGSVCTDDQAGCSWNWRKNLLLIVRKLKIGNQ